MDRRYTPSHSQLSKLFIYYTLPFPHCEYQQCIKYKPGSNSTINDKVDLQFILDKKIKFPSLFFLLMTIEPDKKLFETDILDGGRFLLKTYE
jgi:hypothetical protein